MWTPRYPPDWQRVAFEKSDGLNLGLCWTGSWWPHRAQVVNRDGLVRSTDCDDLQDRVRSCARRDIIWRGELTPGRYLFQSKLSASPA